MKIFDLFKAKKVKPSAQQTSLNQVPKHIAIIMDGNGRWAKQKKLPRFVGYFYGAKALKRTIKSCQTLGIEVLTVFAFGRDNWKREPDDVNKLCNVICKAFLRELPALHASHVCIKIIGDLASFPQEMKDLITHLQEFTKDNNGLKLVIAMNYSGTWDIAESTKKLLLATNNHTLSETEINEQMIANHLSTHDLPLLDLIIRTSGEKRISNFMLWQAAYAELYFTDILWPDFDEAQLKLALEDYAKRERRFGQTSEQIHEQY